MGFFFSVNEWQRHRTSASSLIYMVEVTGKNGILWTVYLIEMSLKIHNLLEFELMRGVWLGWVCVVRRGCIWWDMAGDLLVLD